jgi:hypothetical protein
VHTVPPHQLEGQDGTARAWGPPAAQPRGPRRPQAASLDRATLSGSGVHHPNPGLILRESKPPVAVCIREGALEASVVVVGSPREKDPEHQPTPDPERSAKEADRRARAELRRYCVANRLNVLWTLTYAVEPDDWEKVWEDIEAFRKRLWAHLGRRIAMVTVIEQGSENGRLHVHFTVGERLEWSDVGRIWGHGFVQFQRIKTRKNQRTTLSRSDQARVIAGYLAGYLIANGKKVHAQDGRSFHGKRFSTTRGFSPGCNRVRVESIDQALALVYGTMGPTPSYLWSSSDLEDWDGPPVWVAFW